MLKALLKEIKEDPNKWGAVLCYGLENSILLGGHFFPNYSFNAKIKISAGFHVEINETIV